MELTLHSSLYCLQQINFAFLWSCLNCLYLQFSLFCTQVVCHVIFFVAILHREFIILQS